MDGGWMGDSKMDSIPATLDEGTTHRHPIYTTVSVVLCIMLC